MEKGPTTVYIIKWKSTVPECTLSTFNDYGEDLRTHRSPPLIQEYRCLETLYPNDKIIVTLETKKNQIHSIFKYQEELDTGDNCLIPQGKNYYTYTTDLLEFSNFGVR